MVGAIERAKRELGESPYASRRRGGIRHLKGRWHCVREYRRLPGNRRIYYDVDDARGTVTVLYVGAHP